MTKALTLLSLLAFTVLSACVPVLGILNRVPPDYVIKQPDGSWLITRGPGGDVGGKVDGTEMIHPTRTRKILPSSYGDC